MQGRRAFEESSGARDQETNESSRQRTKALFKATNEIGGWRQSAQQIDQLITLY